MAMKFWRVPLQGRLKGCGFAYHYGTKAEHIDTGIREQDRPSRFVLRGVDYWTEREALAAWTKDNAG